MTWQDYFRQAFKDEPFKSLGFDGEDKNLLAHNSLEAYLDWFCHPPFPEGNPYRDDGFYARELADRSRELMPKTIMEFGTNIGLGTFMLARLNPGARIWTIDTETELPIPGDGRWPAGHIAKVNECSNVTYVQGKSWDFVPRESIDLCFVDGDHSYEAVLRDSYAAWKNRTLFGKGWTIIWHDYRKDCHGLRMAVHEFCQDVGAELQKQRDSTTVWIEGATPEVVTTSAMIEGGRS